MKIKTNIPNILFFFDFSNPLKQIKMKSFGSKTLLKLVFLTLERMRILLLKNLLKINSNGGIYSPINFLPVGSCKGQICPSGRPGGQPANGQIYDR